MCTNPVKAKLRRGEVSFGTWLAFGDLYATRLLARMGFDWLTLDMEHSAIDVGARRLVGRHAAEPFDGPLARRYGDDLDLVVGRAERARRRRLLAEPARQRLTFARRP